MIHYNGGVLDRSGIMVGVLYMVFLWHFLCFRGYHLAYKL